MNATKQDIEILLARHGIASPQVGGADVAAAAHGGRIGHLTIERAGATAHLVFEVGSGRCEAPAPHDAAEAMAIVQRLREDARFPDERSFEHMLADLVRKATELFEDSGATRLEFASLHLHPTAYHIGEVTLLVDKPLHLKPRLDSDTHDRHAIFDHRHGDSTEFPK